MAQTKTIAQVFLHNRFPKWKDDNKTYMIPPIFHAKQSRHQIGITQPVPYSYPEDNSKSIIYNLLRELGDIERMGMFVFYHFALNDIGKWNKKCKNKEYLAPELALKTGECDFIIFHHQIGIISLQVYNSWYVRDKTIELIKKFSEVSEAEDYFSVPYKKVIALPSIKKVDFNRATFPSLKDDTLFLFEDDSQDISSFQKWWNEAIESPATIPMSAETSQAYEQALSYTLMIQHLGPVTESECIKVIHESLVNNTYHGKAAYPQVMENKFPHFLSWCRNVLSGRADGKNSVLEKKIQQSFMKKHKLSEKHLRGNKGMTLLNELLKNSKYIDGDEQSSTDDAISAVFEESYCFFFKHILDYINKMRKVRLEIDEKDTKEEEALKKYPFLKLTSPKDFNMLDRHLARSPFIDGDEPSEVDKQVLESLTCRMRLEHARHLTVMTSEQLVVFEGPSKQLIIGPPGSGKTELMKSKALELGINMKICKSEKKIMYILANGSPDYHDRNSLLFYDIKEFFTKKSPLVEVISIVLEEESAEDTQHTTSEIRKKIQSGEYEHAFIDEYWIGSKPTEHKIILELVRGLPGYVWISSMFNYQPEAKKVKANTQPLLTAVHENGGEVRHITQVTRATNSIIELERDYSKVYADRSYPYGTERILGHSYEGLPVTCAVEKTVSEMYDKCVDIVSSAIPDIIPLDILKRDKITLDPADVLIVDFAIRMNESRQLEQSLLDRLTNRHVPVWTFDESRERSVESKTGKVTLLQSVTHSASKFIDGVERSMVVVILPSGMVLKTAKLADGAKELRKLDPYISFFRTTVKLVVISDKWTNKDEFLTDVKVHM